MLPSSRKKESKFSGNANNETSDADPECTRGAGSGIRTHATQGVTGFQGLRVIHSAIPAITVFLDANL